MVYSRWFDAQYDTDRCLPVAGSAPKNWSLGALRGTQVILSDSPPSIYYIAMESSEYLKPPGCREHFSIFVGVCPPKLEFGGHFGGAKVIPSDSPPSICYLALESSEYLEPPGCRELFSIFVGVCLPKLGFWGHLGGKSGSIG